MTVTMSSMSVGSSVVSRIKLVDPNLSADEIKHLACLLEDINIDVLMVILRAGVVVSDLPCVCSSFIRYISRSVAGWLHSPSS